MATPSHFAPKLKPAGSETAAYRTSRIQVPSARP
jgi:hypothetical protein